MLNGLGHNKLTPDASPLLKLEAPMSHTVLAIVAALALPLAAAAFPPPLDDAIDPAERVERMREHLGLDDAQVEAIRAVLDEARTETLALRARVTSDVTALRAAREAADEKAMKKALDALDADHQAMRDAGDDLRDGIQAELTLTQRALLAERMIGRLGGGPASPR